MPRQPPASRIKCEDFMLRLDPHIIRRKAHYKNYCNNVVTAAVPTFDTTIAYIAVVCRCRPPGTLAIGSACQESSRQFEA